MKTKNKNNQTNLLIIIIVILAVIGGSAIWFRRTHRTSAPIANTNAQTAKQKQLESETDAANKKSFIDSPKPDGNPTSDSNQPQPPAIELTARQEANNTVTVLAKLTGIGSGNCSLVINNSNQQITQSAEVIYQPDYSSCAGFSVPINTLGTGSWRIDLTVNSLGQTYSKSINYEVK